MRQFIGTYAVLWAEFNKHSKEELQEIKAQRIPPASMQNDFFPKSTNFSKNI